ncbi:MAG: PAS domain S-box-containing protein [Granulosicoccus sp.]|jgi:PAS domain S-box-containing protein
MISFLAQPKITLPTLACLFVYIFFRSVHQYESNFLFWMQNIDELRFQSTVLSNSVLSINTGVKLDYDDLTAQLQVLNNAGKKFVARHVDDPLSEIEMLTLGSRVIANHVRQDMPKPPAKIVQLVSDRINNIESIKTHTSILRNSKLIAVQLAQDLSLVHEKIGDDILNYLTLSNHVLRYAAVQNQAGYKQTQNLIQQLKGISNTQNNSQDQPLLPLLQRHIQLLANYSVIAENTIVRELSLAKAINRELRQYEQYISTLNTAETKRASSSRLKLLITAALLAAIGANLAAKNYSQSIRLANYANSLKEIVDARTLELHRESQYLLEEEIKGEGLVFELEVSERKLDTLIDTMSGCIIEFSFPSGDIQYASQGLERIWGSNREKLKSISQLHQQVHPDDRHIIDTLISQANSNSQPKPAIYRVVRTDMNTVWVREDCTQLLTNSKKNSFVSVIIDISELKAATEESRQVHIELAQAQKMESVGMLAAGIAHEINTPAQFVSDNLAFLNDAWSEIVPLIQDLRRTIEKSGDSGMVEHVAQLCEKSDLEYLIAECQPAIEQSSDGIAAIAQIVRAMKEHSHPGVSVQATDINRAVKNTVLVSKSEWKDCTVVETNLEENLPTVECVAGDINQVLLNMMINAVHAFSDKNHHHEAAPNTITVSTNSTDYDVFILIQDNGSGMTEEVKSKVFDHFFTTKDVGQGTGQGLSLAHNIIVDRYTGSIDVDSELGVGTTFTIRLPRDGPPVANA